MGAVGVAVIKLKSKIEHGCAIHAVRPPSSQWVGVDDAVPADGAVIRVAAFIAFIMWLCCLSVAESKTDLNAYFLADP